MSKLWVAHNPHPLLERLRIERIARRLSVDQLVTRTGYSRTYIYNTEQGKRSPSFHYVLDLASFFDLELKLHPDSIASSLLQREDDANNQNP